MFQVPEEIRRLLGTSPEHIEVMLPSSRPETLFVDGAMAVIIPDGREIGVYLVELGDSLAEVKARVTFLLAGLRKDVSFRRLGLCLVTEPDGGVTVLLGRSWAETVRMLYGDSNGEHSEHAVKSLGAAGTEEALRPEGVDKARETRKELPEVKMREGDVVLFESLGAAEWKGRPDAQRLMMRALGCEGAYEGQEMALWLRRSDRRSVPVALSIGVGGRFTARVLNRKDSSLEVDSIEEVV
ncbi:MAG: hypothetical protein ACPLRM_08855 [Anaerolineae bacterium]